MSSTGSVRAQLKEVDHCGVYGARFSLRTGANRIDAHGMGGRVSLRRIALEELAVIEEFDLGGVHQYLYARGPRYRSCHSQRAKGTEAGRLPRHLGLSIPQAVADTGTVPARIMCGIQFFEAEIDDQVLPTRSYVELL